MYRIENIVPLIDIVIQTAIKSPFIAIFVITALILLLSSIFTGLFHLRSIPGPWWAPYSRIWLLRALSSGECAYRYEAIGERYGSLARIGPNHLITSDPDTWRNILGVRSLYQRGDWFDHLRLDPRRATLIAERDGPRHKSLRNLLAPGVSVVNAQTSEESSADGKKYEGREFKELEATIDKNLIEWIKYIETNAISAPGFSRKFEIARSIQWLGYDMICQLCFGHPLGFIHKHADCYDFQDTLERRLPIVERFAVVTEVNWLLKFISLFPILKRVLPSTTDKTGVGKIMGLAQEKIQNRSDPDGKSNNDIVGLWLKRGLSPDLAVTEVIVALFAGSDTTGTLIRGILLYLVTNPPVYNRLLAEIDNAIANGAVSQTKPVTADQISKLPYLKACLKEGMRVFPPVVALRERVTPPEGDFIQGYHIPGGVKIGVNMRGLLTNSEVFGPDPKIFRPERWLISDTSKLREMERVHELAFNWGLTRCLGIRIANTLISKFFFEVFRRWDITIINPTKPWNSRCHGIFYHKDFFVRISPRHVNEKSKIEFR